MKFIRNIINRILPSKKKPNKNKINPLGRWNIENCDKKMKYKVDLSNEDHCGPCGQYVLGILEMRNPEPIDNKVIKNKIITVVKVADK
jgi:hypothetical protein